MWQARRETCFTFNQVYISLKDKANAYPIEYHFEAVQPMWLNLTRVLIQ